LQLKRNREDIVKKLHNIIIINCFLLLSIFLTGCATQHGVARLPDSDQIFVTTAKEKAFVSKKELTIPYQPVGIVEYRVSKCSPCQITMPAKYTALENAINKELVSLAKSKLGAEAVVNFEYEVWSTFDQYLETYAKFAANPYTAACVGMGIPTALLLNRNVVHMEGLAVKKK